MCSRLWLAFGVLLGMLCGLPVIRAQVQPGRPRFPGTLVIASGKTATINNTLTFTGTDASSVAFGAGGTVLYSGGAVTSITGTANQITASASTGAVTLSIPTSPTFTTPIITTNLTFANGQGFLDVAADITGLSRGTNAQKFQIYETRDAGLSNYSRLSISAPSGGPITFASEAAGTGTARAFTFTGGQISAPIGTASLPSYAFNGSSNFGFYAVVTNEIGIGQAGNLPISIPTAGTNIGIGLNQSGAIRWTSGNSGSPTFDTYDTIIKRGGAAATVQHGVDVNGAAVAQTIQAANAITGSNLAGGNLTLRPGAGTGTGTISALIFQSPTLGSTGTTVQTQTTRFTIDQTSARATVPVTGTYLQGTTVYSAAGTALPTCNGGAEGSRAAVSDATLPTFLAAYTSGGAVHASVYCDGTSWKTD